MSAPVCIPSREILCNSIECDSCSSAHPGLNCSRCKTVFYCDAVCQKNHWKQHKQYCRDIKSLRSQMVQFHTVPESLKEDAEEEKECGICLENMCDPFLLECGHSFCFPCLQQYQSISMKSLASPRCPFCRARIPSTLEEGSNRALLIQQAIVNITQTERCKGNEERVAEFGDLALRKLEEILAESPHRIDMLMLKAKTLSLIGKSEHAIELYNEIEEREGISYAQHQEINSILDIAKCAMDRGDHDEADCLLATIEEKFGQRDQCFAGTGEQRLGPLLLDAVDALMKASLWTDAISKLQTVYLSIFNNASPPDQLRCIMALAKCFYHVGQYNKSIELTNEALEMNRHYPGVHKYNALSYIAKGELETAIRSMSRAVLYETPWDFENQMIQKRLLQELIEKQSFVKEQN